MRTTCVRLKIGGIIFNFHTGENLLFLNLHVFMVNIFKRVKNKVQAVKSDIRESIRRLKIYIIAMSALQILTFLIVIVLLILFILEA